MNNVEIKDDIEAVSRAAAIKSAKILADAIARSGKCNWLLAGGTAPIGAYRLLAGEDGDIVNWNKVMVAIGDERCVPIDSADASWPKISQVFLHHVDLPFANQLRPKSETSAEDAATDYDQKLRQLIGSDGTDLPHFDLVWLGMGEDGHTLSLFPNHPALQNTGSLVIPVHDSPKPPPDRMSLTFKALGNVSNCIVMATGSEKAEILVKVMKGDESLPINQAVNAVEASGGQVTWLIDSQAATYIKY